MNNGWIKLHRKILEKGYYKDSHYIHLWIHILLKVNHKENEFLWNNEIIKVKRGQFITGRNELSRETGINTSKIERILKCFKSEQQIEQQTTSKFRLITVKNWHEHQSSEQQNEQQVNNKRTTSEQQMNTNKNDKNIKNDKKREDTPSDTMKKFIISIKEKDDSYMKLIEVFKKRDIPPELIIKELDNFIGYWTELNKSGTKQRWELERTFEIRRRLFTWFGRIKQFNQKNKRF